MASSLHRLAVKANLDARPLSIAYFTAQYFPHMGGVEFYTLGLSKALVQRGHRVTVITSCVKGEPDRIEQDGFTVRRLSSIQSMGTRYPMLQPGKKLRAQLKELLQDSFDVVLVNTKFYPMSILAAWFAKRKGSPCIVSEHGSAHLRTSGRLTTWITEQAEHVYAFWIRLYNPYFVGVSKAACRWLRHFHIKALGPAYNTTDYERINAIQTAQSESFREKWGINKETTLVLFAGRLLEQKGLLQLMEAVGRLKAEGRDIRLIVAGAGPLQEKVQAFGDPVLYAGALSFEQLMALEMECDLFCLPSETEGFPTALLEAAASHLFVVTTVCGGISEIVPDDSYAYRLPDNTSASIYEGLSFALDHPDERKKTAEKLRRRVMKNFTFERTARMIEGCSIGLMEAGRKDQI